MNKQELIDWVQKNSIPPFGLLNAAKMVREKDLIEKIKQLDEPKKQVMPKFFDEWAKQVIERRDKFYAISLITRAGWGYGVDYELDENKSPSMTGELLNWLVESPTYLNKEKAVNALLYGYEVEKEPVYYVKNKNDATYFVEFINSDFGRIWDDEIDRIKPFREKAKADAVALLVDGEVVEG